jgi:hypothetical protein
MPIKAEMRWFYPIDWPQLSNYVRFERAGGACQCCGRPHGEIVRCLPDGRWYDEARQTWRNHRGCLAHSPNTEDAARIRHTRVVLAAAHLDHNPGNNRLKNLRACVSVAISFTTGRTISPDAASHTCCAVPLAICSSDPIPAK